METNMNRIIEITDFIAPELDVYARLTEVQLLNREYPEKGLFIACFDRWNKTDLQDSRYIWLPLVFDGDKPQVIWKEQWNLAEFGE